MEIRDWIMLVSAIIVVIGWLATAYFNRKNEIAKERMKYRLDMLHSFLPIALSSLLEKRGVDVTKDETEEFQKLLEDARLKFQLYSYKDEFESYESIIKIINSKERSDSVTKDFDSKLQKLTSLVVSRIREELQIPVIIND